MRFKVGQRFRLRKPWWKFWFTPWILTIKKDDNNEWWLIDPQGCWYSRIKDYTVEEFERTYERI